MLRGTYVRDTFSHSASCLSVDCVSSFVKKVALTHQAWISGTKMVKIHGNISAKIFIEYGTPDIFEKALEEILGIMENKAKSLEANCVLGLEVDVDPFYHNGVLCTALGNAVELELLYGKI